MNSRTTTSIVTFAYPFVISGHEGALPPGSYEVVVEEELLGGVSFEACRQTASFLLISGRAGQAGATEMRLIEPRDLGGRLGPGPCAFPGWRTERLGAVAAARSIVTTPSA